ncbi:MAG: Npt1/Npt2 family nucleotide transporter [Acidobacteriota bacterium]
MEAVRKMTPAWMAMAAAAAMMAHYIGSKAVRDAVFLSNFPVSSLPQMVLAAAAFSFVSVLLSSRAMTRWTPGRLMPAAFAVSSVLTMAVWSQMAEFPQLTAVLLYLQIVSLGPLLTSGFWSIVNESFEPREAKKQVGKIAGAGSVGGVIGGVVAERMAAAAGVAMTLPVLSVYHLICAGLLWQFFRSSGRAAAARTAQKEDTPSVLGALRGAPYLQTLAWLVMLGTMSAAMIDYVFKYQATLTYGNGVELLRFFALFYAVTGVLSFVAQTVLSSVSLQRLGIARTVGTLPMAVSAGGLLALILPGVWSGTLARGMEQVFRSSLFRAGYELFYMPIPAREKRAAKQAVDVGFDRLGDAIGSLVVKSLLVLGPALANQTILTGAVLVGLVSLWVASRLQNAYVDALEKNLMERAEELDLASPADALGFAGGMDSTPMLPAQTGVYESLQMRRPPSRSDSSMEIAALPSAAGAGAPTQVVGSRTQATTSAILGDAVVAAIVELRSGDGRRVHRALALNSPLKATIVPHVIQLLGWDQMYPEATRALRASVGSCSGQLVDWLLDQQVDFAIRRRIPRVLASARSQLVFDGLMHALGDRRFEVRYQSGRAMAMMHDQVGWLEVNQKLLLESVGKELNVSKPVWEGQRLLDTSEEGELSPLMDEFLRNRSSRSLEHVFTLLMLLLPKEPLRVAFRGLHTDDAYLRGTALEYLESTLPEGIFEKLRPLLDTDAERSRRKPDGRAAEDVLAQLMLSNQSIMVNLDELRRKIETNE